MNKKNLIILSICFLVSSCSLISKKSTIDNESKTNIEKKSNSFSSDNSKVISVTGKGIAPTSGSNSQKRLMALRAAKVDAYGQIYNKLKDSSKYSEEEIKRLLKKTEQLGEGTYSNGKAFIKMQLFIEINN